MGNITLKLEGSEIFGWSGDDLEIRKLELAFADTAKNRGVTPPVLASSIVMQLPGMGIVEEKRAQTLQLMGIMYFILSRDTKDPRHAGKYRDYAGASESEFEFDLRVHGREIRVELTAAEWPDS
ncbi:MAG TPA: hypothetical protein VJN67_18800 [Stellaceae bacterium]|nr:hypothetical protein [Stellaceae bacterium]